MSKEVVALVRRLEKCGWRVERRRKHYIAFAPNKRGGVVTIACTPSDRRAIKNTEALIRRAEERR